MLRIPFNHERDERDTAMPQRELTSAKNTLDKGKKR